VHETSLSFFCCASLEQQRAGRYVPGKPPRAGRRTQRPHRCAQSAARTAGPPETRPLSSLEHFEMCPPEQLRWYLAPDHCRDYVFGTGFATSPALPKNWATGLPDHQGCRRQSGVNPSALPHVSV
jgi:hypothetical protein